MGFLPFAGSWTAGRDPFIPTCPLTRFVAVARTAAGSQVFLCPRSDGR